MVETADAGLVVEADRAVEADSNRLQRLCENLFRNAVDHAGSAVALTVGPLSDCDGFFVANDGSGIPPEDRETVSESGYSTAEDGTGFCLSIVETIADVHDWSIILDESVDGGARFAFETGPNGKCQGEGVL